MIDNDQVKHIAGQLNSNDKKKLLFIVPESAGDIFLSTSLLPTMSKNYNEYEIYFACKSEYKDILINNPYIIISANLIYYLIYLILINY